MIRTAILAGPGVGVLPTFLCGADLAAGRLEAVLTDHEPEAHGIYAVHPHNRHLSAKVRAFVDYLVGCFPPVPPVGPARGRQLALPTK